MLVAISALLAITVTAQDSALTDSLLAKTSIAAIRPLLHASGWRRSEAQALECRTKKIQEQVVEVDEFARASLERTVDPEGL
ncbi:hypothetical protein AZE42_04159 [Rhizopogon vesiculosus]|uniref:Uncharacterized protein n=1 Tax=Rhizopogon vesiculosus TaxID=180088 RepID=A0A1J8PHR5_9AGAM|nr:hypothetical protein AZE42_04159 [Rhizopogon vesiculosus]